MNLNRWANGHSSRAWLPRDWRGTKSPCKTCQGKSVMRGIWGWRTWKTPKSETPSVSCQSLFPDGDDPLVGARRIKHRPQPRIPTRLWTVTVILFCLMMVFDGVWIPSQINVAQMSDQTAIYPWDADWETGNVLLSHKWEGGAESGFQHAIPGFATDSPCNLGPSTELSGPACPSQMENRTLGSLDYFCPVSVSSMCLM